MIHRLLLALLLPGLAACDSHTVEVEFAEPFPPQTADLPGFAARDQGHYCSLNNRNDTLLVTERLLLLRSWQSYVTTKRGLDSLGAPRRAGVFEVDGELRRVQLLATDSFRVSWPQTDTLLAVGPGRLRRFRGWYYLNKPAFYDRSSWEVQRLIINRPDLHWQPLGEDTLRLQALPAGTVTVRHELEVTHYVLRPRPGPAVRQMHRYAGLWMAGVAYRRCPQ